jgi:hypothetical protein
MLLRAKDHPALHDDHPGGWARSRPTNAPRQRLVAWLCAIAVVAVLAITLHALYY